jgi:hypothetical protein
MTTNYSENQNNASLLANTGAYIAEKSVQGYTFIDLTALGLGLIEVPLVVPGEQFTTTNVTSFIT